jgi:hypothetical protein
MTWDDIDTIEWTTLDRKTARKKITFSSRTQRYIFDRLLNNVDLSDFIQALKLRLPDKTKNLGRHYYSTEVHGLVVKAHQLRTLKQPDAAEQSYREAIAAGERLGSPLGLGMIPVLEEYAFLLERQGKQAEVQATRDRIASLQSRVT